MKLHLSSIYIYPIKSFPAVMLREAEALDRGLADDRRWMLVDNSGRFISLREERKLLDFAISSEGNNWRIGYQDAALIIPKELPEGESWEVQIWDDHVQAIKGPGKWDQWFEERLGYSCHLVYMPPKGHRPVKQQWALRDEEVSFADGYPYLIVNEESVRELERRAGIRLDIRRFRPNLVLSGGNPFDEFRYRRLSIGEVVFNGLKPCIRCVVTTLDPDTGEQGKEPLKTLAEMKIDGKVVFGQHASVNAPGTVRVGDTVEITARKDSPYDPL